MKFVAFERTKQGTGASRRLRISGRTPGIVYGAARTPELIELDHNSLWHALKKEAFHASILDMELNGKESKVLLRDVQYHPFKQQVLHVDFQRVEANHKLTMKVPLHFSGEEQSPAVKLENCLLTHIVNEITVSCLPADLPEFIAVDLSGLKKGSSLHLSNLVMPKGVTAVVNGKFDPMIVSVVALAAPAETEAAPAADAKDAKEDKAAKPTDKAAPAKK